MADASSPIKATTLSEADCIGILDEMHERFTKFAEKVGERRQHFHRDPLQDPDLGKQFVNAGKFQTDLPRRVHSKLKARLTENRFVFSAEPARDTVTQRENAEALQTVLNEGFKFLEQREGIDVAGGMSDGQIIQPYAVLHWLKADHIWPAVPDYEYLDEAPEDPKESARFEADEESGRLKETAQSLAERRKRDVARVGFPFFFEFIAQDRFMFLEDRSLAEGFAMTAVEREVGLLDYAKELKKTSVVTLAVNEVTKAVRVYGETDAPAEGDSAPGWGTKLTVRVLWTRDEFYELVSSEGNTLLVKSDTHPYEMPPFVLVPGPEVQEADPLLRYESALEGVFRLKPSYDRIITYMLAISEMIALPYYYLRKVADGTSLLDEKGNTVALSRDSSLIAKVPDGYEIASLPFELNPAFVNAVQFLREELKEAAPATGQAEFTAATKPWTARLEQAQENVEPGKLLANQARALAVVGRNMAKVMAKPATEGGFGETVWVFGRTQDGKVDRKSVVGVDPADIDTLDIDCTIDAVTSVERITKIEHGRELLNDEKVGLSLIEFIRDYEGADNPDEVEKSRIAAKLFTDYLLPGLLAQKVKAKYADRVTVGADGTFVGMGGQPLTSQQVLAMNQPPAAPAQPPGGALPPPPPVSMPGMPQLEAPGAIPVPGLVG